MTDAQHAGGSDQPVDELVVHRVDHDQSRARRTLLSGVPERGIHRRGHSLVEVRVGVDDQRVLAAHLCDHSLHVTLTRSVDRGPLDDVEPDRERPGERHERHVGVLDQMRSHLLADTRKQRKTSRR